MSLMLRTALPVPQKDPSIKGASTATMGYKGVMKEFGTPLPH